MKILSKKNKAYSFKREVFEMGFTQLIGIGRRQVLNQF